MSMDEDVSRLALRNIGSGLGQRVEAGFKGDGGDERTLKRSDSSMNQSWSLFEGSDTKYRVASCTGTAPHLMCSLSQKLRQAGR